MMMNGAKRKDLANKKFLDDDERNEVKRKEKI
jgi:hypothetical protein